MEKDGAVAIVVYRRKILLMLRDDKPKIANPNTWGLIGGGIKRGETPEQGVRREMQEEINVNPRELIPLGYMPEDKATLWVYFSRLHDSEIAFLKLGREGQDLRFFTIEEVSHLPMGELIALHFKKYKRGLKKLIEEEEGSVTASELGLTAHPS
jgi:8-oxo-dGTP pyrophosphatase MutT (NUDIX family)